MSQLFDQILNQTPFHVQYFVDMSFDIADRIQELLDAKGMQQKDLAKALGKQESEVSKWLSGTHNFTLKTLAKITEVLGADVVQVVKRVNWENYFLEEEEKTFAVHIENFSCLFNTGDQDSYFFIRSQLKNFSEGEKAHSEEQGSHILESDEGTIIPCAA